jgi:glycosyltransferase involved in cell wall biosynthesis
VISSRRTIEALIQARVSIFLLIPDLIGVHQFSDDEQNRISMADGLLTTSRELEFKYKEMYKTENIQVLHDFPPFEALEDISREKLPRKPLQIVWVGNSQWGRRAGFVDHKGLYSFALPIVEEVKKSCPEITFLVIDSAVKKVPYDKVLRDLRQSACLIFTSDSEGTGLPLIEAAALGTPVVTLNVGIASELLKGDLGNLISSRSVSQFSGKVLEVLRDLDCYSKRIAVAAERYRDEITADFERLELQSNQNGSWRTQTKSWNVGIIFKWKIRWFRQLLNNFLAR